jgi:GTP cyclohydrolase II
MAELTVECRTCARLPTDEGLFQLCLYANNQDKKEHLAITYGDFRNREDVLVRIHSECFTGDVLGSRRCDCGEQLHLAMEMIADEGRGVILYLRQEGRGIGLYSKLLAYNLQDGGLDTVDANIALGHQPDERDYTIAVRMLEDLDVRSVRLLTNNPAKIESLRDAGVRITERLPLQPSVYKENLLYLDTKVRRMRHMLSVSNPPPPDPSHHG